MNWVSNQESWFKNVWVKSGKASMVDLHVCVQLILIYNAYLFYQKKIPPGGQISLIENFIEELPLTFSLKQAGKYLPNFIAQKFLILHCCHEII